MVSPTANREGSPLVLTGERDLFEEQVDRRGHRYGDQSPDETEQRAPDQRGDDGQPGLTFTVCFMTLGFKR